jgi:uncharacterized lipoprotein YajG
MFLIQTGYVMALVKFLPIVLLTACTSVTYTASCRMNDTLCQRNQNAQTLSIIGEDEAALQLLCAYDDMLKLLGDKCTGTNHSR